ncbi:CAP domain-containing protein [Flavobacterium maritimum]|uniref:CAP domain-containing protein n=1 Tax=Flavobacterium maritimum TaxID=3149042 RepID=UPI0032B33080
MKLPLFRALLLVLAVGTLASCSSEDSESTMPEATTSKVTTFSYNASEVEAMDLINAYRVSIGLNALEKINHISFKSEEHDNYMIANNVVNHNDFASRSENIIKVLGAKTVSENIAYNYSTSQAALEAWLNSPGHKVVIEGDFTHFGIAIRENPVNGKKYYTNIFAKI